MSRQGHWVRQPIRTGHECMLAQAFKLEFDWPGCDSSVVACCHTDVLKLLLNKNLCPGHCHVHPMVADAAIVS
jgi:hypothetical protein